MSTPFPLNLETVVFVKSHVEAIPDHEPSERLVSVSPENKLHVAKVPDQERLYSITMKTVINPDRDPKSPYAIEMECMAAFEVAPDTSEQDAIRGVTITGHSVVYGAIREAVAWLTARQPYGPLVLGLSILTPQAAPNNSDAPVINEPTEQPAKP